MKFSLTIASLLLLVPLIAQAADVEARDPHHHKGRARGGFGGGRGGGGKVKGGKGNGGGAGGGKKASSGTATTAAAVKAAGGAGAAATSTTASVAAVVTGPGQAIGNAGDANAAQASTTLNPQVIAKAFASNGQAVAEAGQVASLTSTNNFINFCLLTPNVPITNGQQVSTGSCNPTPHGLIFSKDKIPTSKFSNPVNNQDIAANTPFNITMNIVNMQTGAFTSAVNSYYAAPQQLNPQGLLIGHSHFVVEPVDSLTSTKPTSALGFVFFKGVNGRDVNGVLSAPVPSGLPAGTYRLGSINTAANHQPALCPIAQHGLVDDVVYFTVGGGGGGGGKGAGKGAGAAGAGAGAAGAGAGAATTTAAAAATSSSAASGKGGTGAGAGAGASGKKGGQQQQGGAGGAKKGQQGGKGKGGGRKGGRGRFYRRSSPSRLE